MGEKKTKISDSTIQTSNSSNNLKATDTQSWLSVKGRIHVLETEQPVPGLIVSAFVIRKKYGKKKSSWLKLLDNPNALVADGIDISDDGGYFEIELDKTSFNPSKALIGLMVQSDRNNEVWCSPALLSIHKARFTSITLKSKEAKKIRGFEVWKSKTTKELESEENARIENAAKRLKLRNKEVDNNLEKLTKKSKKAFKNFKPTSRFEEGRRNDSEHSADVSDKKLRDFLVKIRAKPFKGAKKNGKIKMLAIKKKSIADPDKHLKKLLNLTGSRKKKLDSDQLQKSHRLGSVASVSNINNKVSRKQSEKQIIDSIIATLCTRIEKSVDKQDLKAQIDRIRQPRAKLNPNTGIAKPKKPTSAKAKRAAAKTARMNSIDDKSATARAKSSSIKKKVAKSKTRKAATKKSA